MDDGQNNNSFVHVSGPASAVVISLAERAGLTKSLKASLEYETKRAAERAERQADFMSMEVKRGRELITKGIHLIQTNGCPQDAIDYMRSTLAAIDGSTESS